MQRLSTFQITPKIILNTLKLTIQQKLDFRLPSKTPQSIFPEIWDSHGRVHPYIQKLKSASISENTNENFAKFKTWCHSRAHKYCLSGHFCNISHSWHFMCVYTYIKLRTWNLRFTVSCAHAYFCLPYVQQVDHCTCFTILNVHSTYTAELSGSLQLWFESHSPS